MQVLSAQQERPPELFAQGVEYKSKVNIRKLLDLKIHINTYYTFQWNNNKGAKVIADNEP